jgi:phospholipid/cholesterol/gamma-HCH transport system permease protein
MDTAGTTTVQKKNSKLKQSFINFFTDLYKINQFILRFFKEAFVPPFEFKEVIRQCFEVGVRSFTLISVTGFIVGVIFTKQSRPSLSEFGATSWLPSLVTIAIIRALAPLVTALISAGKIGSNIGAELGSMKVTEQIDAMEVSGANPMQFLVVTRILACIIMIPLLTIIADGVGMIGGYAGMNLAGDMTLQLYFSKSFDALEFSDLVPAVIKTVFFGFTIGFVGCYKGFHSNRGTESVGLAANTAVVTASVGIILIDAIAAQVTNIIVYTNQ